MTIDQQPTGTDAASPWEQRAVHRAERLARHHRADMFVYAHRQPEETRYYVFPQGVDAPHMHLVQHIVFNKLPARVYRTSPGTTMPTFPSPDALTDRDQAERRKRRRKRPQTYVPRED